MATEKAIETTATQNSAPKAPAKISTKASAKPRASAAATVTTKATAPVVARKRTRTKTAAAKAEALVETCAPEALSASALNATGAALERALLETEASKSLNAAQGNTGVLRSAARARCGQCGREMRFVPFSLSNLMCRSCYGLDRYRRPAAPTATAAATPQPGNTR